MILRAAAYKSWPFLILVPLVGFSYLKFRQNQVYRRLKQLQQQITTQHEPLFTFKPYPQETLPTFEHRFVSINDFLPHDSFETLKAIALKHHKSERSYLPGHKKGGTISYEELHAIAPEIVAFYNSSEMRRVCSDIVGEPVVPTPINDQSSCSLLCYNKPGDHIGWHYDHNFYNGRHFTVLLPLVNERNDGSGLSSAELLAKLDGQEVTQSSAPNTLIMFEGAEVVHKVTKLAENETRIILSMTFCTNPTASLAKSVSRRVKDTAFFGVRALWT